MTFLPSQPDLQIRPAVIDGETLNNALLLLEAAFSLAAALEAALGMTGIVFGFPNGRRQIVTVAEFQAAVKETLDKLEAARDAKVQA